MNLAIETCRMRAQVGEMVMTNRQNGVPMSDVLSRFVAIRDSLKGKPEAVIAEDAIEIVQLAYKEQMWASRSAKRSATETFRDKIETSCFEAFLSE